MTHPPFLTLRSILGMATVCLTVGALGAGVPIHAQSKKDFAVSAHKYGFTVAGSAKPEIHVQVGDLVRITFSSDDIPHSFTIVEDGESHYRIMRRAEAGRSVTFEFLADKAGRFPFKCTLSADERCKEMEGWLVVDAK